MTKDEYAALPLEIRNALWNAIYQSDYTTFDGVGEVVGKTKFRVIKAQEGDEIAMSTRRICDWAGAEPQPIELWTWDKSSLGLEVVDQFEDDLARLEGEGGRCAG